MMTAVALWALAALPAFAGEDAPLRFGVLPPTGYRWEHLVMLGSNTKYSDEEMADFIVQHLGKELPLAKAPSIEDPEGADVLLRINLERCGGTSCRGSVEAISAASKKTLERFSFKGWPGLANQINGAFAPGGESYAAIAREKRGAGGIVEREPVYAGSERLMAIARKESEGDAALEAKDHGKAFAAYTAALSGEWSDDPASERVRGKYMKLLAGYRGLPDLPEEARRRMARGKGLLRAAQNPEDLHGAAVEMALAICAAPWWWDAYYNLGLVQEKEGHLSDAMKNLKLYLAARPSAPDAQAVQDKIYGLEARLEKR